MTNQSGPNIFCYSALDNTQYVVCTCMLASSPGRLIVKLGISWPGNEAINLFMLLIYLWSAKKNMLILAVDVIGSYLTLVHNMQHQ